MTCLLSCTVQRSLLSWCRFCRSVQWVALCQVGSCFATLSVFSNFFSMTLAICSKVALSIVRYCCVVRLDSFRRLASGMLAISIGPLATSRSGEWTPSTFPSSLIHFSFLVCRRAIKEGKQTRYPLAYDVAFPEILFQAPEPRPVCFRFHFLVHPSLCRCSKFIWDLLCWPLYR